MLPDTTQQWETDRLLLRYFRDDDLPPFLAYRNDPEVARYQSWESIGEETARRLLAEMRRLRPGLPGEWFLFAIELKETGALIGDCTLKIPYEPQEQGEIGYTLDRAYQGKGYASEAVRALLDLTFLKLDLHRVTAIAHVDNARSLALMERIGMRQEAHFIQAAWFKGEWCDQYQYAILQEEWTRNREGAAE